MNKKTGLWIALDLIFVVVFNVVFFILLSGKHPASVWVAYAFIHIAYIMVVVTPFLTRKGRDAHLFGTTIASISTAYFITTLISGIVIIAIHPETVKWTIIVEVVLTGIYAVMLLINMLANEHTAEVTVKQQIQLQYVRGSSARLNEIMSVVSDKKLKKKLQRAYDIVHSSQVYSSPAAQRYEVEVLSLLDNIEDYLGVEDLESADRSVDELIKAANKRNSMV